MRVGGKEVVRVEGKGWRLASVEREEASTVSLHHVEEGVGGRDEREPVSLAGSRGGGEKDGG